jgi:hypothetical protein
VSPSQRHPSHSNAAQAAVRLSRRLAAGDRYAAETEGTVVAFFSSFSSSVFSSEILSFVSFLFVSYLDFGLLLGSKCAVRKDFCDEVIHDPKVTISGPLAQVWTKYKFILGMTWLMFFSLTFFFFD